MQVDRDSAPAPLVYGPHPAASYGAAPPSSFPPLHISQPQDSVAPASGPAPPPAPDSPDHTVYGNIVSPPTPPGAQDFSAKIATPADGPMAMDPSPHHHHKHASSSSARSAPPRPAVPQAVRRPKCDLFAFAAPVMW